MPAFSQNDYPVYAEEAVVPASALVARPDGLDAVGSAAVWMPYVTVYADDRRDRPGAGGGPVVVTSAANSVGVAALHVLRHLGAVPIATVGSPAHAAGAARRRGGEGLTADLLEATDGHGADLVLDADGGPQVSRLVKALRAEHFVRAGLASGAFTPIVDRVFEFDDVAAAPAYVDSPDRAPGKAVLRVCHGRAVSRPAQPNVSR